MRQQFSKRKYNYPLPDLSRVQIDSYDWLKGKGLSEVVSEISPVSDTTGRGWELYFSNPRVDKPNTAVDEALEKGDTYDAQWYLSTTLKDTLTNKSKTQDVYMGDIPLMTVNGTFIINGVERVVVNQLTRSEGVFFIGETDPSTGKNLAGAKILPKSGAWLEIETSRSGVISVKIDRRRKIAITALLRVFGLSSDKDIEEAFTSVDIDVQKLYIATTLQKDPAKSLNEAYIEIYRKMRPGEPLVLENAKALVESLFFSSRRYSLGRVGRFKLNQKLGLTFPNEGKYRLLQLEDLIKIVQRIIELNNGVGQFDDIDNLGNRRVRSVGELLQNQIRIGFLQMERNIKERMSIQPRDKLCDPGVLISTRPVAARIHSFFASGQLSQFQDQQNPLTSLDHLRRLSVMGPGGLTKERASLPVRDVHYSHYGRICPVRTPEGPNIGLINYIATYARVNDYGFLEAPYYKLEKDDDGKVRVTDEVMYLAAYDEYELYITDASVNIDERGYITDTQVPLRYRGEFLLGDVRLAQFMDVIPQQVVGISAALIPFLANDDTTRTLVATQQTSQAVPLIKPEAPLVGTGLEPVIAENAGACFKAKEDGTVEFSDASKVVIKYAKGEKEEYHLKKFVKSNMDTCYNQRTKVKAGDKVKRGQVIFEGPSVWDGELAIGTNLKVAYMVWGGYEFEDGILISDRLVKEDVLSSIHITDHKVQVLETKLGPEEVTRDIPNVSEDALRNLDDEGIVAIGSKVKAGDILVGKIAPKGETELSAEERLLRAIFGEKAREVRDNSLVLPHGEQGTVIGVKIITKKENDELPTGVIKEIRVYVAQIKKIEVGDKLAGRHGNKGVISKIVNEADMPHLEDGTPVDIIFSSEAVLKRMNVGQILEAQVGTAAKKMGKKYSFPVFEKVPYEEIEDELRQAGLPVSGKSKLIDGRTGDYFDHEIVVGDTYILKLIHMSEEKMHARSTGPYSLITQQPLGGKAQFGGQRFGEMEVWALEAYGAAHTLQEILTIKSDDLVGRTQAFRAILQGEKIPEAAIPESFKLLVKELNGLCLSIETIGAEKVALDIEKGEPNTEELTKLNENIKSLNEAVEE